MTDVPGTCEHGKQERINLSSHGIAEEILVCSLCGIKLDSRPLREQDMRDLNPRAKLEPEHREVRQESLSQPEATPATRAVNYQVAICKKHGGDWPECTTGARKAHECTNSKWSLGPALASCACRACHVSKELIL